MIIKDGTRVWHQSRRMATVVKRVSAHNGYRVKFDEPHPFAPDTVVVRASTITPVHPATHAEYEAAWPSFERRHREKWCNDFPTTT